MLKLEFPIRPADVFVSCPYISCINKSCSFDDNSIGELENFRTILNIRFNFYITALFNVNTILI